jgi:hypothetical protein
VRSREPCCLPLAMPNPPHPSSAGRKDRRAALAEYWNGRRFGMVERLKPLRDRYLDRDRILGENSCFQVSQSMFEDSINLTIVDEDDLARRMLETAEFYLQTAIERDDVGVHRTIGQVDLGRSVRLKHLIFVRWLRQRKLDLESFRESVNMKKEWNEQIFAQKNWRQTGFDLYEWMAELLILGGFEAAKRTYEKYIGKGKSSRGGRKPEDTLCLVADSLAHPDDTQRRDQAEATLDKLYSRLTDWTSESQVRVLHEERLQFAYLRGKYFKGEEDPIRLIKRMKFGD